MKWYKVFISVLFSFSHYVYSDEIFTIIEPINDNQLSALYHQNPGDSVENFKSLNIRFDEHTHSEFLRVEDLNTKIEYNEVLACNGVQYPTIMLKVDYSYDTGTYSNILIDNLLYIYDTRLNLINYDKSNYKFSLHFESGSKHVEEHRFSLQNLETFVCYHVERELSPKSVEKAFATNKIYSQHSLKKGYSEYSIGKIKAMFEAYPLSKRNVTQYNNIAYYFEKHKAFEQSTFVLEKILDQYPTRTVAYINLGDAYWGLDKRIKAKAAYQKYVELMKANEREHKIPQKVLERVES